MDVQARFEALAGHLKRARLRFATEKLLQDDIETLLAQLGIEAERELRLKARKGVIDFRTADGIGIECKVEGSASNVLPQFQRYCEAAEIDGLLVVTSCARHRWDTATLCGKPFAIVWVGGGAL